MIQQFQVLINRRIIPFYAVTNAQQVHQYRIQISSIKSKCVLILNVSYFHRNTKLYGFKFLISVYIKGYLSHDPCNLINNCIVYPKSKQVRKVGSYSTIYICQVSGQYFHNSYRASTWGKWGMVSCNLHRPSKCGVFPQSTQAK